MQAAAVEVLAIQSKIRTNKTIPLKTQSHSQPLLDSSRNDSPHQLVTRALRYYQCENTNCYIAGVFPATARPFIG